MTLSVTFTLFVYLLTKLFSLSLKYFETRLNADNVTVDYATNFLSYIGIASKVPNIAFQALNFLVLGG